MRDARPRLFHGLVAGLLLVILVAGLGTAVWLALDLFAGVMRGNG